jgi:hypothetical protein
MKPVNLTIITVSAAARTRVKTALLSGLLMAFAPWLLLAQPIEKTGTYVAHFVFRPLLTPDVLVLGTVAPSLEATPVHCTDGACVLTDSDGDKIFSTFDTRDLDKSQPKMVCGTHIITGATGKYKGITGSEPFACIAIPPLTGPGS